MPLVFVQADWFIVFYTEVVAFTEGLVWFSLFVICDVCFEADDPIVWSCDQELVVCQLDLWTGQFHWTVRGGKKLSLMSPVGTLTCYWALTAALWL